jgi:hypothetical protein
MTRAKDELQLITPPYFYLGLSSFGPLSSLTNVISPQLSGRKECKSNLAGKPKQGGRRQVSLKVLGYCTLECQYRHADLCQQQKRKG